MAIQFVCTACSVDIVRATCGIAIILYVGCKLAKDEI